MEAWGCDCDQVQRKYNEVSVQRMSGAVRYGSRASEAKARRGDEDADWVLREVEW